MNIQDWIIRVFRVPRVWNDEDSSRRAEVLHIAHIFIFLTGLLYLLIPSWDIYDKPAYAFGMLSTAIFGSALLRRGELKWSGIWTIGTMWLAFTIGSMTEDGMTSSTFAGNIVLVIGAGLTYGVSGTVTVAVMTIASGVVMLYLKMHGMLPLATVHYSDVNIFTDFVVAIVIATFITAMAIRRIERTTRRFEAELAERKLVDGRLRESEHYYRSLIDASPDAIVIIDRLGKLQFASHKAYELFNVPKDHAVFGNSILQWLDPEYHAQAFAHFRQTIVGAGKAAPFESLIITKDGQRVWAEITGAMLRDVNGKVNRLLLILRDITDRKTIELDHRSLQAQLLQSQKIESIGTLAAGIAHDFNNILNIIVGNTELLAKSSLDEKSVRRVSAVSTAAERATHLVNQLLMFARKTDVHHIPLYINDIIGDTVRLLSETFPKTITVEVDLAPDIPCIIADPNQMHQVLMNLSVNARDAMPSGGTLGFSAAAVPGDTVRRQFHDAASTRYVAFTVRDTGTGMDEKTLLQVFDPFFTTKGVGKGTGLGMSVVQGIIQSHHGCIDVQSRPGAGTSIRMFLPVAESPADAPAPVVDAPHQIGNETILLIEDEELTKEIADDLLASHGYRVIHARDGADGVEVFAGKRGLIDLVVSDFGLPVFNGETVFQRIRELDPTMPFILISGYLEPEKKAGLLQMGVTDIIAKPFKLSEFHTRIRKALDA